MLKEIQYTLDSTKLPLPVSSFNMPKYAYQSSKLTIHGSSELVCQLFFNSQQLSLIKFQKVPKPTPTKCISKNLLFTILANELLALRNHPLPFPTVRGKSVVHLNNLSLRLHAENDHGKFWHLLCLLISQPDKSTGNRLSGCWEKAHVWPKMVEWLPLWATFIVLCASRTLPTIVLQPHNHTAQDCRIVVAGSLSDLLERPSSSSVILVWNNQIKWHHQIFISCHWRCGRVARAVDQPTMKHDSRVDAMLFVRCKRK